MYFPARRMMQGSTTTASPQRQLAPAEKTAAPVATKEGPVDVAVGNISIMKIVGELENLKTKWEETIAKVEEEARARIGAIKLEHKGEPGEPGRAGADYDFETVVKMVLDKIPTPKNGEPGKDAVVDVPSIARAAAKYIKPRKDGKPAKEVDHGKVVDLLQKRIEGGAIKLEGILEPIVGPLVGKHYGKTTWARGGGDTVAAGSGVSIVTLPSGQKQINAVNGGTSSLMFVVPSGTVNGVNKIFTVVGTVIIAGADDGNDPSAGTSYNPTNNTTYITYSVPPQNNVFAFAIATSNPQVVTPTGIVNKVNVTFTAPGRVSIPFADRIVDVASVLTYNPATNITTITYSVPPQNQVSALTVSGFTLTTQTPTCTTNASGNPDGSATLFSAVGQINAAVGDSGIDINASLAYNYATNVTIITYSVPPQNNVSTF